LPFDAIVTLRSYEQVARQIETRIRDGGFVEGQKLPTERELGVQFGVSRSVVREAIKTLDALGLVESRQGSGIYVRHDPVPSISRVLTLSVKPRRDSVRAFYDFRALIEPPAARDAARLRTPEQLATIEAALAANLADGDRGDIAAFRETDMRLHMAISEAAGNPYLAVVVGAVVQMRRDVMHDLIPSGVLIPNAVPHHERIVAAIVRGDAAAAEEAMRHHIATSADEMLSFVPDVPDVPDATDGPQDFPLEEERYGA